MEVCLVSRGEKWLSIRIMHIFPWFPFLLLLVFASFFVLKVQTLSAGERQKDVVGAAAISSLAVIPSPPPPPISQSPLICPDCRRSRRPCLLSPVFKNYYSSSLFPENTQGEWRRGGLCSSSLILWVHSPPDDVQTARFDSLEGKKPETLISDWCKSNSNAGNNLNNIVCFMGESRVKRRIRIICCGWRETERRRSNDNRKVTQMMHTEETEIFMGNRVSSGVLYTHVPSLELEEKVDRRCCTCVLPPPSAKHNILSPPSDVGSHKNIPHVRRKHCARVWERKTPIRLLFGEEKKIAPLRIHGRFVKETQQARTWTHWEFETTFLLTGCK